MLFCLWVKCMNDIIEQFNQNDNLFAKDAILEARKYKGKINDLLLQEVENYSNDLAKQPDTYPPFSVIYSIYLLAEFKDKRLFPTLIRLFSQENDEILDILGDWVLDDLAPILVSVFPNDYESLNSIIENAKINKYIRAEFLNCYSYFYFTGMISQDELEKYLRHLIELCKTSNDDDYIFAAIADFIADIHLFSMLKDVEELYKENRVELSFIGDFGDFIDSLFDYKHSVSRVKPIEDTIKKMGWWACFDNSEPIEFNEEKFQEFKEKYLEFDEIDYSKVGRNDPCPCGSGKKFKKCCIDKAQEILPYQKFITQSLEDYPKRKENDSQKDLYDFYKKEYIEIDKLMYRAMKRKRIPIFIQRNYEKEEQINLKYLKEAFEKVKELLQTHSFHTIDEYDDAVSIHFSLYQFYDNYSSLLCKNINKHLANQDQRITELETLVDFFYNHFDLKNDNESLFLNTKEFLYMAKHQVDEGIKYFTERLQDCLPSIKFDIYEMLLELLDVMDYEFIINKIEELIQQEKDKNLKTYLKDALESYKEDY